MAPKRGGSGGGGEAEYGTYQLTTPEGYHDSYTASAVVQGILAVACFILFIISLYIYLRHWRKKAGKSSGFVPSIVISTFYWFLAYLLALATYVRALHEDTVYASWVLVGVWSSTLSFLAEFTFLAAMYSILHNRLRTVTISKPTTELFAFINWSLFAVCLILGLVWLGDQWAYAVLFLQYVKTDTYIYDRTYGFEKYSVSDFHVHHARKIGASMVVFRFIIQFLLIVLGFLAIVKTPKVGVSADARGATLVFFFGIGSYIVAPMTALILEFKYWEYSPDWVTPVGVSIGGIILVVTTGALCMFANMLSPVRAPGQWNLGTRKYAAAPGVQQDYYNPNPLATDTQINTPAVGVSTPFPAGAGRY